MQSMHLSLVVLAVLATVTQHPVAPTQTESFFPVYVPERVYQANLKTFSDFEVMLTEIARADVVMVGEQHDDPNTHRLEAAILQGLVRRNVDATVSLEMFERDAQYLLDGYLGGSLGEGEFLKGSRPWPRYATDYRPLVELARVKGWPVIASNVPRTYASAVAKGGMGVLDSLPPVERTLIAHDIRCPIDAYFERFAETMNSHPMPGAENQSADERRATNERFYFAQCIKDETMAESIAREVERKDRRPGPVVHYNGAFHRDFGAGAAERVRRRLPGRRVVVISMLPVENIDAVAPDGEEIKRADFLVYTVR
jgi:uncharacterized iron-regulated protein